jgi:signal transduction histidine kinase
MLLKRSENSALSIEIEQLRKELERKVTFEKTITNIAVSFVFPSELEKAIEHALKELLIWSGVDRVYIMQVNPDNELTYGVTHEVCKFGVFPIKRFAQNIPITNYEYFEKTQRKFGFIAIPDTRLLPEEAVAERALYKKTGVRSAATCSFTSRKKFMGFVGLFNRRPIKEWNPEILQFLTTVTILMEHSFERIEAEKKIIRAKELAEENERIKSAFMANLSHEIRTPLNGILGFSKLLTERTLTEEKQKQYAGIIEVNSKQLLSVINDLLDISKIESGRITLNKQEFNINVLLSNVFEFFRLDQLNNNKINLKLEIPNDTLDYTLFNDQSRLKQVLDNLLKNAIKFTPQGNISLGYFSRDKQLYIYVADSGIGISQVDQKMIFKRFWQLDPTIAHPYGGNGIGLSITNDLVRLMGGNISVESEPDKGSLFIVEIPYLNEINLHSDPSNNLSYDV